MTLDQEGVDDHIPSGLYPSQGNHHHRNRVAGSSLLEAAVFGRIADAKTRDSSQVLEVHVWK
jgi:succinate dehydrogenase/fumarate reductase flavoprotein subunit